jgi:hypothetical protein
MKQAQLVVLSMLATARLLGAQEPSPEQIAQERAAVEREVPELLAVSTGTRE